MAKNEIKWQKHGNQAQNIYLPAEHYFSLSVLSWPLSVYVDGLRGLAFASAPLGDPILSTGKLGKGCRMDCAL